MKHYNKILVGCVIASSVALTGCTEDSPITNPPVNHEKVEKEMRIDLFDASVFACMKYLDNMEKSQKGKEWWGDK